MPTTAPTERDDALLRRITRRIVEAVDPERIILFGSRAKGTATEESDIDLCVIAEMNGSRHEHTMHIHGLFSPRSFSMDVFVFTPEEFEQRRSLINHLCYYVQRDGKVLYERA